MTELATFTLDIGKFSEVDRAISEIATNASMLKITDLASKEQYDKVHDTRMTLVKMRTQGIDKIESEIKAPHLAFAKAVGEEATKRREQLKAIEKDLQAEEDKVNEEKERIRAEKAKKAQEKTQERLNKMLVVGGCTDVTILGALSDQDFEIEFLKAEKTYDEKKRAEEQEIERKRIEDENRKIESEKLKKQQEEMEERMAEMRKKEKEIQDRHAEIERLEKIERDRKQKEAQDIIDIENARKKAENDKIEADRIAKEKAEKEEAERPEKEKAKRYIEALLAVQVPDVSLSMVKQGIEKIRSGISAHNHYFL
jgi:hypothetical protein